MVDVMAPDPDQLTPQEHTVLLALVNGSSNRELADGLCISIKTVETHLTRLYRKVGCRSRAQVIAAFYTGAIDPGATNTAG